MSRLWSTEPALLMLPFAFVTQFVARDHVRIQRGSIVADVKLNPNELRCVTVTVGAKVLWKDIPKDWHPWKLAVTDLNHDGKQELIVALFKLTRHSPSRLHTLFVYGFDGAKVFPKWRGSTLGRDFTDFAVLKSKKGDRIVTLDRLLDGRIAVTCRKWDGFGFRRVWERDSLMSAKLGATRQGVEIETESGRREYNADGVLLRESK